MSLLGIDLGTTGIKCAAYDEEGKMLCKTYREYQLCMPKKGVAELDQNLVIDSLFENIKELNSFEAVLKDPVEALSISVSGDDCMPIDKSGEPLYNAIMSMDTRGYKENEWINKIIGAKEIYRVTGQPPSNLYPLNKLIWFKQNKPELFEKIYKFLCWEEFIFMKLGAEPVSDYSVACRTLAFDLLKKQYSEKILMKTGIDINLFPKAVLSGTAIGSVDKRLGSILGFKNAIKIVTGGFDQICAALGSGVVQDGMASIGTGTMELMQICFKKPATDSRMMNYGYPFCNHALDNLFITMSINYCGGVIFKWYRDNFSQTEREYAEKKNLKLYDVIMDLALKSRFPVQFLPYFEGSQTPRNNPDVTGAIFGMTLRTKREDIIKGMFEGITFDLRLNIEKMEQTGIKISTLRATGGGARSDTWLQIKADVTGKLIQKIDIDESGCMAVAALAGYGIGKFNSVPEVLKKWVKIGKEFEPDMKKNREYKAKYEQWLALYDSIEKFRIIH
ncbi:MAG: FGGY-family carbohydrate kinase [Chitinophagaceae bacterium]